MGVKVCELEAYVHTNGRCFVDEFLADLTAKEKAYADWYFERLEEMGRDLRRPHAAHLENQIFELRVIVPGRQIRLLYFFFDQETAVFTHGVIKKGNAKLGNKLDPVEVNRAKEYRGNILTGKATRRKL
jgi:hypothetical protein